MLTNRKRPCDWRKEATNSVLAPSGSENSEGGGVSATSCVDKSCWNVYAALFHRHKRLHGVTTHETRTSEPIE
jgi:hypothetical protein